MLKLSDYINVIGHYDEYLLRTKQDHLMATIQLSGLTGETKSEEELKQYQHLWSDLYTSISNGEYLTYFHVLQKEDNHYPKGDFRDGFAKSLNTAYAAAHKAKKKFYQTYYLTIIHVPPAATNHHFFENFSFDQKTKKTEIILAQMKKSLMEVIQRFMYALKIYQPELLGIYRGERGLRSRPLEFIYYLLNLTERSIYLSEKDYSALLPDKKIIAENQTLIWQNHDNLCHAGMLGIKAYCGQTHFAMLNQLLALPGAFILTQVYLPKPKPQVLETIHKQHIRLKNAGDKAISQLMQINHAEDQVACGAVAYGEHTFSLLCISQQGSQLAQMISKADAMLIDLGIHAIREERNLELAFLGSIPGNQHYLVRRALLSTVNVADLCTFNHHYRGNEQGSIWGEPVCLLSGKNGGNIFFNFHVDKVGSSAIYGQTGSGKTLLTDFLLAQSTKFLDKGLRIFFFDYLRGSEPFIRALGGTYIRVGHTKKAFNPLQMPDTAENRRDLAHWVNMLLRAENETLDISAHAYIHEAIDTIYANPIEYRNLAELEPSLNCPDLRKRLRFWHTDGARADYFGAKADQLSLESSIIGMDMTGVLKDEIALAPTLFYLLMRIRHAMQQTAHAPFIIVLEEGWSLLRCHMFREILEEWILTIRRLNGIIIFLTQNPEQLSQYPILSDIIHANVQTKVFFPNYQASREVYCKMLGLSETEYELIKSTPKSSHYFLLKQAEHSCLATLPLAGLEDYISVLSGDMKKAVLLDELRRDLGDDVNTWLAHYIEKCKKESSCVNG